MSKESLKRQIESKRKSIEREKQKISGCRKHIADERIKKSRKREYFSKQMKSVANSTLKASLRRRKERDFGSIDRSIENYKSRIERINKTIGNLRADIKRIQERMKGA